MRRVNRFTFHRTSGVLVREATCIIKRLGGWALKGVDDTLVVRDGSIWMFYNLLQHPQHD
jgi:hypothetical protein